MIHTTRDFKDKLIFVLFIDINIFFLHHRYHHGQAKPIMKYIPVTSDDLPIDDNININTDADLCASSEDTTCRFCLENCDRDGICEMVSPCRCDGTIKYVHRSCLLQERETKLENGTASVDVCSTCKTPYELIIKKTLPAHPFWMFVRLVSDGIVAITKWILIFTKFILSVGLLVGLFGLIIAILWCLCYFFFFHEPFFIVYDPDRYDVKDILALSSSMLWWWIWHYVVLITIIGCSVASMYKVATPGHNQEENTLTFAEHRIVCTVFVASVHVIEIGTQCTTLVLYTMYKDEHAFLQLLFPILIMYRMTIILVALVGYSCFFARLWADKINNRITCTRVLSCLKYIFYECPRTFYSNIYPAQDTVVYLNRES